MQKLPKNPTKIWGKNLVCPINCPDKKPDKKLLESFNKILAKNFERYRKNY